MAAASKADAGTLHLRVQNPKMNLNVPNSTTIKDIMISISKENNTEWNQLQLMDRSSFPPKVISTNPYLTLTELNVMNQTTISVRKLDKALVYNNSNNDNSSSNNDYYVSSINSINSFMNETFLDTEYISNNSDNNINIDKNELSAPHIKKEKIKITNQNDAWDDIIQQNIIQVQ